MLEQIKKTATKTANKSKSVSRGNLVIGRKTNESLFVGNAKITIVSLSGGQVGIAINAPKYIMIKREELLTVLEKNMLLQQS